MDEKKFNILATLSILVIAIAIGSSIFWDKGRTTGYPPEGKPSVSAPLGANTAPKDKIVYLNNDFGFTITLPSNWQNYSLVTSKWMGIAIGSPQSSFYAEGPIISVRNPLWTRATPRQDIPVMVFTLSQWDDLQRDVFHIGAAPIKPSELGRNANYVFALPARYNFAFLPGYEEVQQIIDAKSVQAF